MENNREGEFSSRSFFFSPRTFDLHYSEPGTALPSTGSESYNQNSFYQNPRLIKKKLHPNTPLVNVFAGRGRVTDKGQKCF